MGKGIGNPGHGLGLVQCMEKKRQRIIYHPMVLVGRCFYLGFLMAQASRNSRRWRSFPANWSHTCLELVGRL